MRHPTYILAGALGLAACATLAPGPPPGGGAPAGEAAPGWVVPPLPTAAPISREEFQGRRAALAARMDDGVLVVLGAEDSPAGLPFVQDVAFRYLTGITEPGAALLIQKEAGEVSEQLFVLPRDAAREVWDGIRLGAEGATARTGIPARSATTLAPTLESLIAVTPRLYTVGALPSEGDILDALTPDQQLVARIKTRRPGLQVISLAGTLDRARAAKSAAEIDRIRRAVYITTLAHRAAMAAIEPGMNEFEIHGLVEYTFRRNGAERPSFPSIIGSGPNSTTLHYRSADRFMQPGETVVMDIGASYDGYAADVTRTVPVSGEFDPEQRSIYEIVLAAQKAAEARAVVGASTRELEAEANRVLAEGLARVGLIDSASATYDCSDSGTCPQYRLFYMHGLGHGIGLEVHDPDVSDFGPIRAGSVFTIEPGIYVRPDVLDHLRDTPANRAMALRLRPAVQRYRDIGVRIEDDYVITAAGSERLSAGAPREVAEIEALMRLPPGADDERRRDVVEWYRSLHAR